ncbi:MAG: PstS family phosphate ABC transporter substrate-binding protein [Streptosporangiaceae bacterium]
MRLNSKLLASATALATAVVVTVGSAVAVPAGPALADPPAAVTPRPGDVVGVGADTLQYLLDQLAHDYDKNHPKASSLLYSWDETNPGNGHTGDPIVTKAGCAAIARPDGSSAGITALEASTTDPSDPGDYCIDYAGSSRAPAATDPACGPGGVCFIQLAGDAVTWAARDKASGGTDAPATLTLAQLKDIYLCKITNWSKVGGTNATIQPFVPQQYSGTTAFWLTALGGGKAPITPGPCVSNAGGTLQDNEGISPVLDSPEAIVPYSVGDYIAQVYHSAPCTVSACTGAPPCTPTGGQNLFGCDQHGVLGLGEIGGTEPMLPWPAPNPPCSGCKINPKFSQISHRTLYAVVRYAASTGGIPANLATFFAPYPTGFVCTSFTARKDIEAYGFTPLIGYSDAKPACGTPHGS